LLRLNEAEMTPKVDTPPVPTPEKAGISLSFTADRRRSLPQGEINSAGGSFLRRMYRTGIFFEQLDDDLGLAPIAVCP